MSTASIRPGFPTASPYLVLRDIAAALVFYQAALGAEQVSCHTDPSGRIAHAEIRIGDSTFMFSGEHPAFPFMRSVETVGGSPVQFFLYVDEVDARFARALAAGGTVIMPVSDQPYGRSGGFQDPFGFIWWLSTHTAPTTD
jgi:PhnB protein